ncbi:MAG: methyltransferase protein [Frankiales bacterium]|jgi:SAM-dependent methyltransferase|nr:methyltransferase protein [Frankiales bacterium]
MPSLAQTSSRPARSEPRPEAPPAAGAGTDPSALLTGWFSEVAAGDDLHPRLLRLSDGRLLTLPVARWAGPVDVADESLLVRALGPVLDVGCGPGRLTAALHRRGVEVLGLELVEDIPVLARAAGAPVHYGDVHGPVPRPLQWQTIVLADGNIGIGGDVPRLLGRLRDLLAPDGSLLCELHPGAPAAGGLVRLEGLGAASAWFPWTLLGKKALPAVASAAGLTVSETWSMRGRDFASLRRL